MDIFIDSFGHYINTPQPLAKYNLYDNQLWIDSIAYDDDDDNINVTVSTNVIETPSK